MSDSYPALIELISRLEGKDKKTCELALYCLNKADESNKRFRAENERLKEDLIALVGFVPTRMIFDGEKFVPEQ